MDPINSLKDIEYASSVEELAEIELFIEEEYTLDNISKGFYLLVKDRLNEKLQLLVKQ